MLTGAACAAQIDGQTFDDSVRLGATTLKLNGVGLRQVAWLKGYAAGLYLAEPARTQDAVHAMAGPKRLQMRMLLEAETIEFAKAIDKGIPRNTPPTQHAALAERQQRFREAVLALKVVRPGDVVNLDYLPDVGMTMTLNGRVRGPTLPGADFYAAVMNIFIGVRPVDVKLKAGLLAGGS